MNQTSTPISKIISDSIIEFIDRLSAFRIGVLLISIIFCFGIAYYILTRYVPSHGVVPTFSPKVETGLFDCLYFSLVTISSLGYGDFRPLGISRILAVVEVLSGLLILAALVSKVVAFRTSKLTYLIYTADANRLLREYCVELQSRRNDLSKAILDGNGDQIDYVVRGLFVHLNSVHLYYKYHSEQGALNEEWALKASARLGNSCSDTITEIFKVNYLPFVSKHTKERVEKVVKKAHQIVLLVSETHQSEATAKALQKCVNKIAHSEARITKGFIEPLEISPWLLEKVFTAFPPKPWESDVTKVIAKKLGLSNKTVSRVIKGLVSEGKIEF